MVQHCFRPLQRRFSRTSAVVRNIRDPIRPWRPCKTLETLVRKWTSTCLQAGAKVSQKTGPRYVCELKCFSPASEVLS